MTSDECEEHSKATVVKELQFSFIILSKSNTLSTTLIIKKLSHFIVFDTISQHINFESKDDISLDCQKQLIQAHAQVE